MNFTIFHLFRSPQIFSFQFPSKENEDIRNPHSDWIPSIYDFPNTMTPNKPHIINKISALVKDLFFLVGIYFSKKTHKNNYSTKIIKNSESEIALLVLLHGFRDRPATLDAFYDVFKKRVADITIFHPKLIKGGNCTLEEASNDVYKEVKKWSKKNIGKPIVFCGVSNGSRLSAHIAYKLKVDAKINNPIKVNAFCGPFFGTIRVGQFLFSEKNCRACKWSVSTVVDPDLMDELHWGSEKCKEIISNTRTAAKVHKVSFDFYASWADWLVTPFISSLPKNVTGANYYVLKSEGHGSLVNVARENAVKESIKFIENNQN